MVSVTVELEVCTQAGVRGQGIYYISYSEDGVYTRYTVHLSHLIVVYTPEV